MVEKKRASRNTTRALDVELTPHLLAKVDKKRAEYKGDLIRFAEDCLYVLDRDAPPEEGLFRRLKFSPSQLYIHRTIEKIEDFNIRIAKRKRAEGLDVPLVKGPVGTITLKARKVMATTYFRARAFWKNEYIDGHQDLVMAHNAETAEFIAGMMRIFHDRWIPQSPNERRDITRCSSNLIEWASNSRTMVKTAGARGQGAAKGTTLHYLHFSEIASYEDGTVEMSNATEAAAKYREEHLESTSNGVNMFKDEWDRAEWLAEAVRRFKNDEPMKSNWNNKYRLFWAWHQDDGYRVPLTKSMRDELIRTMTDAEHELVEKFKLDAEQLEWRRQKINNECSQQRDREPEEHFKMHYPSDPDEAWVGKGKNVFPTKKIRSMVYYSDIIYKAIERGTKVGQMPYFVGNLVEDKRKKVGFRMTPSHDPKGSNLILWEPPKPKRLYLIAADPAEGLETSDDSVCAGADRTNGLVLKEAFTYASKIDPEGLADVGNFLGRLYNNAYLIGERNKDGIAMMKRFLALNYPNMYHHKDPETVRSSGGDARSFTAGFLTGPRTKRLIVDLMYSMLQDDAFFIFHKTGLQQLEIMTRDENGNPCAPSGKNDDFAVVYCLLAFGNQPDVGPPVYTKNQMNAEMAEEEIAKFEQMNSEQKTNYFIKKRVEEVIAAARKRNQEQAKIIRKARAVLDEEVFD